MLFSVIPNQTARGGDVATVMEWITDALMWQGVGAKTAVGYGRFERDTRSEQTLREKFRKTEEERRKAARLATLPTIEREIETILADRPDKQLGRSIAIYQEAIRDRWSSEDKNRVAKWLKAEMQRDKTWRPSSKKPSKDKAHKRTLQVRRWLNEG